MPQLPQNFNARNTQPAQMGASQFPVSPKEGWPVVITSSEMVATSSNQNNGMLVLHAMIIEGENQGCEGVYRLNIFHDNPKTVEIAYAQLSAVCWCVGKPDAKLSEELHNIPLRMVVVPQKVKAGEEDKGYTEIKGVLDINGNAPGKAPANTASPAQPVAPPTFTPPAAAQQPVNQPQATAQPAAWGAAPTNTGAPAATGGPAWAQNPVGGQQAPWGQK